MSPSLLGGIAGLLLGFVSFAVLQFVAARVEANPNVKDRHAAARTLRGAAIGVLLVDTVIGYIVGPMVLS
jgi:hypothetical protein